MEPDEHMLIERLNRILDALLSSASTNVDNVFIEKLITHLSAQENGYVLQEPLLEWIKKCLNLIETDFKSVNPKVISFMLKLSGILAKNEWTIIKMKECKIIDRIWEMIKINTHQFNAPTKLATITMLSAIAQYSFGIVYMRIVKAWQILLDYCNSEHTVYVVREAQQLLYQLLYNFSVKTKDEELLIEMLGEILKPILTSVYSEQDGSIHINVEDSNEQRKLSKTLDLISFILQKTLESKEKTNIVHICTKHFNIEINTWKMFEIAHNPEFVGKIVTCLCSYNFALLLYTNWEATQIPPENFNYFGLIFFNQVKFTITRFDCINFLKLIQMYHVLWKKLGKRAPKVIQIEKERVCFEYQLAILHSMPLFLLLQTKEILQGEIFDDFQQKMFEVSCEQTQRLCYAFRDMVSFIMEGSPSFVVANIAYKCVSSILSLENNLEREHAIIVFKALIYPLQELVLQITESSNTACVKDIGITLDQKHNVLYNVLVGLRTLIERYHVSWKESIETIGLVNCVGWLLESSNLPTRLTVQGLKLIQLSIEHFLSPNMALLVNSLHGSGLVRLGPMIIKRVHDDSWDVRDSVVELVVSIADISRKMFPAFQEFLIGHKICAAIYEMMKYDSEPYVRASAFRCLTNFVSINLIWENELKDLDVIEHLFYVLYNDSEGIVRREAVVTLAKIYDYRKIPPQHTNRFYSTIAYSTINDLHWEVKVNALNFWKLEIQRQFTYQGMIDGTFPTVTFSKEHRKIVTLTEKEINLRIIKALNELSQRGCLGIILKCLTEDCDLEVIKAAVHIVLGLLKMIEKYNYESLLEDLPECKLSPRSMAATTMKNNVDALSVKPVVNTCSDAVINDILQSSDHTLLTSVYEKPNDIDLEQEQINETYFKQFTNTSAKEFITIVKSTDFDKLLQKNEWHLTDQSLFSLMEDILCILEPDEAESIVSDCY